MTMELASGVTAAKETFEILEKLGMIDKLLLKLKNDPHLAHDKLRVVLLEIRKTCEAIANTINEIDILSFEDADLSDTRHQVKKMVDGPLIIDLQIAKGSCARIGHIYRTYLSGWFSQVLNEKEATELKSIFDDLSNMDGHVLKLTEKLYFQTLELARFISQSLEEQRVIEAKKGATAFTQAYRPYLSKLNNWLAFMYSLDAKLIKTTGIS